MEVLSSDSGTVNGSRMKNAASSKLKTLPVKGVFLAIGHVPNTAPFSSAVDVEENGYFAPIEGSQVRTKVAGVYVAGVCADHEYRQAITAEGMDCPAAIEAERWLASQAAYSPPEYEAN